MISNFSKETYLVQEIEKNLIFSIMSKKFRKIFTLTNENKMRLANFIFICLKIT